VANQPENTPRSPLVFTHIPRTAGTSLRAAVTASLEPELVFNGFGRQALGRFSEIDSLPQVVRRQIALEPADLPAEADLVCGHIPPSTTRARVPEADHFTVLREPRVRLISLWLFARAHSDFALRRWRGFAEWMRAARSNLVDYIGNPLVAAHVDNSIARLLLWPHDLIPGDDFIDPVHDDELFEEAVAMLDTFAYAGIVENPDFLGEFGEWFGRPLSMPRLNGANTQCQPDPPDLAAAVSGSGADLLSWRTRVDDRLWSHLAARAFGAAAVDEVRERTYRQALDRYTIQATQPVKQSYRRRIVERSYSLIARRYSGRPEPGQVA
jgi:hypothetical protein